MFDGVPHDQLHQFIASSRTAPNPLPLVNPLPLPLSSFPLHHVNSSLSPQAIATTASNIAFDSYSHHHQLLLPLQQQQHQFLHHVLHHKTVNQDKEQQQQDQEPDKNVDLDQIERERSIMEEPWSNEEVLALLRIRSTMESWFPDFTWEHVSRKLAELGFKTRSAEKCKEKFEEENRYFNNMSNCTKSFRPFLSELEELYSHTTTQQNPSQNHDDDDNNNNNNDTNTGPQKTQRLVDQIITPSEPARADNTDHDKDKRGLEDHHQIIHDEIFGSKDCSEKEEDQKSLEATRIATKDDTNMKKRKRQSPSSSTSHHLDRDHHRRRREKNSTRFEMFKGFCEDIVNKLMAQQEEMHNKLLEDMVKRDQEKLKKEEAWKKKEMDRMNKELEIMAREQAVAGDRQTAIIEFLRKFTSSTTTTSPNSSSSSEQYHGKNTVSSDHPRPNQVVKNITTSTNSTPQVSLTPSTSPLIQSIPSDQNPNGSLPSSSTLSMAAQQEQNPSSQKKVQQALQNPSPGTTDQDLGKRWPRDEVLALINLRCSLYNNGDQQQQQDLRSPEQSPVAAAAAKAVPLWERISLGMSEMGYKRSAKRCKEKWENINKYFRKTKDVNKKRSVDSRTCPYFHQLSNFYNKGTLHDNHHQETHDHDHDHHRLAGEGERSDHIITNTSSTVGVVPAAFDFEF